jgi:hypothetical protein
MELYLPSTSYLPIYRVSPQLLVTSEHIKSERASTSSSFFIKSVELCPFSPFEFPFLDEGSGEVRLLRGVNAAPS